MIPLPTLLAPFVDAVGRIKAPWNFYLQQFTQAPPSILPIVVGISPFEYQAAEPGFVVFNGGTVTLTTLTRGSEVIIVEGTNLVPVSINDIVTINYAVAPTIRFIPSYGQRTG